MHVLWQEPSAMQLSEGSAQERRLSTAGQLQAYNPLPCTLKDSKVPQPPKKNGFCSRTREKREASWVKIKTSFSALGPPSSTPCVISSPGTSLTARHSHASWEVAQPGGAATGPWDLSCLYHQGCHCLHE